MTGSTDAYDIRLARSGGDRVDRGHVAALALAGTNLVAAECWRYGFPLIGARSEV
jgi:hypothetical protein